MGPLRSFWPRGWDDACGGQQLSCFLTQETLCPDYQSDGYRWRDGDDMCWPSTSATVPHAGDDKAGPCCEDSTRGPAPGSVLGQLGQLGKGRDQDFQEPPRDGQAGQAKDQASGPKEPRPPKTIRLAHHVGSKSLTLRCGGAVNDDIESPPPADLYPPCWTAMDGLTLMERDRA